MIRNLIRTAALLLLGVFSINAQALTLTPCDPANPAGGCYWVEGNNSDLSGAEVAGVVGSASTLSLFYKAEFDPEGVLGSFEDSYITTGTEDDG